MNQNKLKKVLAQHAEWLADPTKGKRADLRSADLICADLRGANLRGANLRGADLRGANLRGADLRGANLRGANLRGASLYHADLSDTNLTGADLRSADLRSADLRSADLRSADLRSADLHGAKGIIQFTLGRHLGFAYDRAGVKVQIGCEHHSLASWLKSYKKLGQAHGYSKEEVEAYGDMLKLIKKNAKLLTKQKKGK